MSGSRRLSRSERAVVNLSRQIRRALLSVFMMIFLILAWQFSTTPGACIPISRPGGGDAVLVCDQTPQ
jgi:hypothetical protein